MFTYLKDVDCKIYERYLTIETNIKTRNNSSFESLMATEEV